MDVAHSARGFKREGRKTLRRLPLHGHCLGQLPLSRRPGRLPAPCPCSVPDIDFSVPTLKIGPVIVVIVVCLLVAGLVALAVIEPRPPLRHFEVPVPNERFAR